MASEMKHDDVLELVRTHDSDIKLLSSQMSSVSNAVNDVAKKLDSIVGIVNQTANKPTFNASQTLNTVKDIAILVGLIVTGIVYVARSDFQQDFALMGERQKSQAASVDFRFSRNEAKIASGTEHRFTATEFGFWCKANKILIPAMVCPDRKN